MKKQSVLLLLVFIFSMAKVFPQTVVVTDDNTYVTGQASSVLDVKSISKGFLAPRMTLAQRVAISSPAEGLLVYQIDGVKGFYYYTNGAWAALASGSSGSAWALTGNTGTISGTNFLGTTDLISLKIKSNSIQRMIVDSLGNVGIGTAPSFTAGAFQEKFLVDAGITGSFNAIVGRGSINNYLQLNIQNLSSGTSASSDVVATADNGNETVNYVDMGINSSTNTQNIMGAANDAYLYTTGNNFLLGTGTAAKALVFMTGGTTQSTNERMRIDGSGNVGIGTTAPAYKLHIIAASNPLYLAGVQTGANTDSILTITGGVVRKLLPSSLIVSSSNAWSLVGNSSTNPASNFLGTIDAQPLVIKTSNTLVGRFDANSLALGIGSTINNSTNSYALGSGANVGFNHIAALALGNNAAINTDSSFAIGTAAVVNGPNSFAIGSGSATNSNNSFAVGRNSSVGYGHTTSMAIGNGAAAGGDSSFTIGPVSAVNASNSFAIGAGASSNGAGSMAIGRYAYSAYSTTDAIAVGENSAATASNSIAIGSNASIKTQANAVSSIALGNTAQANSANAIAIGTGAVAGYTLTNPLAIGAGATANGSNAVALGNAATVTFVSNSTALGANTSVSGANSTALGYNTIATKANEILLGDLTNSSLSVGIGTETFSGTNREKLLVDAGTTTSVNAIVGRGTLNNYLQLNIQNLSNGVNASSDVVATADNGNETTNFVDMGINSSTNSSGIMGGFNDSYLYNIGQNFLIGTGTTGKALVFLTGGTTQSANERMRIDGTTGFVGIGTTSPATALHVVGTNPLTLMGVQTGATSDSILTITSGTVRKLPFTSLTSGSSWSLLGNAGTTPATNFLGTTDNQSLVFKANNQLSGKIDLALNNTIFGYQAAQAAVTGNNNTFIGYQSGFPNTSGLSNTSVGGIAMVTNTSGSGNAAFGYAALKFNTTGGSNAAFGNSAGVTNTTGANNTFIGTNADAATASLTNATAVGYNAKVAASNSLVLGGTGVSAVNVGIGTTSPVSPLQVVGTNPLSLNGVQVGANSDSILTIASGTVRKLPFSSLTSGSSWGLTGNTGTSSGTNYLGTTDLTSLRFRSNAIQRMVVDSLGNVGIGTAPAFTTGAFQEKFLVDAGTTSSVNAIVGRGSINNYLQLNIQNQSNGTSASSDVVATADNGSETTNFVDMGINSSTNSSGVMGAANDSYLYNIGQNFLIGTGTAAKALVFMAGGTTQSTNERMRIDGTTGFVGIGTNSPAQKLDVTGNLNLTGAFMPGGSAGTAGFFLNSAGAGTAPTWIDATPFLSSLTWELGGNNVSSVQKIGTISNFDLPVITNNTERMRILGATGFVGIGTNSPATALQVNGTNPLTLMGVQTGATTDSLLTITAGTVRKIAFSAATSGTSWSLQGNAGTTSGTNYLGTTDLKSLRFRTNATQGIVLDSLGNVGIGTAPGFTTGAQQEKFLVDAGTTSSVNAIVGRGNINNYLQLNIQNQSNGVSASSDVVATADNGNEIINFVDMGINSSANTQNIMGAANDAYLYTTGNNFLLGTGTAAKAVVFMTGGTTQSTNERMRIDGTGNVGIGKTAPLFKLDVKGRANFDSAVSAPSYSSTVQALTSGTIAWDQTKGAAATVTLTGNSTLSMTNTVAGMYGLIRVKQDATGSRTLTLPAGSKVINGGGGVVTLTTAANAVDVLSYFYDGTNYFWTIGYNYN